jgi:ethanolamine utilization protein EutN
MFVAKVIGSVWCTKQHGSLQKKKLMLVQPVAYGEPLLAVDDKMGSGPGDVVLIMDEGGSARQVLKDKKAPVRTIVCGIVDSITVEGKTVKYH